MARKKRRRAKTRRPRRRRIPGRLRCPGGTETQSVLVSAKNFSAPGAAEWAAENGFAITDAKKERGFFRFQQRPRSRFKRGSLRTIELDGKSVKAVIGCPVGRGPARRKNRARPRRGNPNFDRLGYVLRLDVVESDESAYIYDFPSKPLARYDRRGKKLLIAHAPGMERIRSGFVERIDYTRPDDAPLHPGDDHTHDFDPKPAVRYDRERRVLILTPVDASPL